MSINLIFDLQRFDDEPTTERKLDLSGLEYDSSKVYIHATNEAGTDPNTYKATKSSEATNAIGMINSDGSITLYDG